MTAQVCALSATMLGDRLGYRPVGGPWWAEFGLAALALLAVCLRIVFPQASSDKLTWWRDRRRMAQRASRRPAARPGVRPAARPAARRNCRGSFAALLAVNDLRSRKQREMAQLVRSQTVVSGGSTPPSTGPLASSTSACGGRPTGPADKLAMQRTAPPPSGSPAP
jgi:hypothetical protein